MGYGLKTWNNAGGLTLDTETGSLPRVVAAVTVDIADVTRHNSLGQPPDVLISSSSSYAGGMIFPVQLPNFDVAGGSLFGSTHWNLTSTEFYNYIMPHFHLYLSGNDIYYRFETHAWAMTAGAEYIWPGYKGKILVLKNQ